MSCYASSPHQRHRNRNRNRSNVHLYCSRSFTAVYSQRRQIKSLSSSPVYFDPYHAACCVCFVPCALRAAPWWCGYVKLSSVQELKRIERLGHGQFGEVSKMITNYFDDQYMFVASFSVGHAPSQDQHCRLGVACTSCAGCTLLCFVI